MVERARALARMAEPQDAPPGAARDTTPRNVLHSGMSTHQAPDNIWDAIDQRLTAASHALTRARANLNRNRRISLECDAIAAHARGDHATERAILDQIHALDTRTTSRVPRR